MVDINHIDCIKDSNTNIIHNSPELNLTNLLSNPYSQNEFNNLILNSNLEDFRTIK